MSDQKFSECPHRHGVMCTHIKNQSHCRKCGWKREVEQDRKLTIKLRMREGAWNGCLTL